ncbi:MAG: shikimate dehydrogenase [Pseudomonadota bacterium]|nr:shikimate dehydrogenase [Pseudomonadota bacterium]
MIRAFVTGWPVGHSLSPLMHGHWLARHGIDGSYEALEKAPGEIGGFFDALPESGWAGGNVTLPHKQAAFRACGSLDDAARAIGAVNTLWVENGKLAGSNTDAYGFLANLDAEAGDWDDASTALVLGAGGAARAIVHALVSRGFSDIAIANRTIERAAELVALSGNRARALAWEGVEHAVRDAAIIVNTTSLGMNGQPPLDVDLAVARDGTIVTDIVYTPLRTGLLASASERGLRTVDGLGMLMHQAVPGFERWFGTRPEVDERLRAVMVAELERRSALA